MVEIIGRNNKMLTYCSNCHRDVTYDESDIVRYEIIRREFEDGTKDYTIKDAKFEYIICPSCGDLNGVIPIKPFPMKGCLASNFESCTGFKYGEYVSKEIMEKFVYEQSCDIFEHTREYQYDKLNPQLNENEWGIID